MWGPQVRYIFVADVGEDHPICQGRAQLRDKSPLISVLEALGGGIRTAGSACAFALGGSTIEGALGGGMLGMFKPIASAC